MYDWSTENGGNINFFSGKIEAKLNQWEYWGGDGQKFILEPVKAEEEKIIGDVNADGQFSVLDIVMMQRFLLNQRDLMDSAAGDLCEDSVINAFDLAIMKRMLLA